LTLYLGQNLVLQNKTVSLQSFTFNVSLFVRNATSACGFKIYNQQSESSTNICCVNRYDPKSNCTDATTILSTKRCSSEGYACLFERILSFLKAEWKVSDTGSAQCWASSLSCHRKFHMNLTFKRPPFSQTRGSALSWACVAHLSFCYEKS
jgi:hypothetical protein